MSQPTRFLSHSHSQKKKKHKQGGKKSLFVIVLMKLYKKHFRGEAHKKLTRKKRCTHNNLVKKFPQRISVFKLTLVPSSSLSLNRRNFTLKFDLFKSFFICSSARVCELCRRRSSRWHFGIQIGSCSYRRESIRCLNEENN